jgi:hypothetical protein
MSTDQVLDVMRNMYKKWHGTMAGDMTVRSARWALPACSEGIDPGSARSGK